MMMIGMKTTMMTTMMTSCQIFSEEANHVDRLVMLVQVEALQVALDRVEVLQAQQVLVAAQVALVEVLQEEQVRVEVFQVQQVRVEAQVAQVEVLAVQVEALQGEQGQVEVRRSPSVNQLVMLMLERQ
tara:strand:- start:844 stop:1227 length:384 start_codon:yes stop_codon:yes gene_type:complete